MEPRKTAPPILATLLLLLAPLILTAQLPTHSQLALGVDRACEADSSVAGNDALLRLDSRLSHDARKPPLNRELVWRLACVRAHLAVRGAFGHSSYLMPLGSSWRHGASMLTGMLLDDSVTTRAAKLLAVLNADPVVGEPASWTLDHLEAAINAGVDAPEVDRECVMSAWRVGAERRARSCAARGLASGHDSTFHLLTMARVAALDADTGTALMAFLTAARSVHDSTDRADLYWQLRWFLTPAEDSAWRRVPDRKIEPWLHDLLEVRDVRDGRAPGSRVVEHFRRLAFVESNFRLKVLPISRDRLMNAAAIPDAGGGGFTTLTTTPNSDTPAEAFRDLIRWQAEFDDRGVVWMRFGRPHKRWFYSSPVNYVQRETWRYDLDGRELLLSFESEQNDGSQGASRLVTGVIGEHFCGIDAHKCFVGERSTSASDANLKTTDPRDNFGITPEELVSLRRVDKGQIVEATTKDDNSERASRHLTLNAQFLRLWQPGTGRLVAVIPWAIRIGDLDAVSEDTSGTVPIRLKVLSYDPALQTQFDSTIRGNLVVPDQKVNNGFVIGHVVLPTSPGVTAWSVSVRHDTLAAGRVFNTAASPIAAGPLKLSDVVLGVEGEGVTWSTRTGPIVIAPFSATQSDRPVQLYYQVMSQLPAGKIKTTVAIYRSVDRIALPALKVSFEDRINKGFNEVRRELGVNQLRNGTYRLEVRVEDESGRYRVSRSSPLIVER